MINPIIKACLVYPEHQPTAGPLGLSELCIGKGISAPYFSSNTLLYPISNKSSIIFYNLNLFFAPKIIISLLH